MEIGHQFQELQTTKVSHIATHVLWSCRFQVQISENIPIFPLVTSPPNLIDFDVSCISPSIPRLRCGLRGRLPGPRRPQRRDPAALGSPGAAAGLRRGVACWDEDGGG